MEYDVLFVSSSVTQDHVTSDGGESVEAARVGSTSLMLTLRVLDAVEGVGGDVEYVVEGAGRVISLVVVRGVVDDGLCVDGGGFLVVGAGFRVVVGGFRVVVAGLLVVDAGFDGFGLFVGLSGFWVVGGRGAGLLTCTVDGEGLGAVVEGLVDDVVTSSLSVRVGFSVDASCSWTDWKVDRRNGEDVLEGSDGVVLVDDDGVVLVVEVVDGAMDVDDDESGGTILTKSRIGWLPPSMWFSASVSGGGRRASSAAGSTRQQLPK